MTQIRFKRLPGNDNLPLPCYATGGAAGMDLRAFLPDGPVTFQHGDLKIISTGFSFRTARRQRDAGSPALRPLPETPVHHSKTAPSRSRALSRYLSGVQQRFDGLERAGLLRCLRGRLASKRGGELVSEKAASRS
jgi:hypothetical protein